MNPPTLFMRRLGGGVSVHTGNPPPPNIVGSLENRFLLPSSPHSIERERRRVREDEGMKDRKRGRRRRRR